MSTPTPNSRRAPDAPTPTGEFGAGTALDDRMAAGVRDLRRADILVGIPSFNNAATIAHVTRTVVAGLREAFPGERAVVVNADGGSHDGTRDRLAEVADGIPAIVGTYVGLPGKGSAFRAIFEAAGRLGARACAVVDSDLRSIEPRWIERLVGPVLRGEADYVTPLYARHKHDGTITNTIAYPLTRALYGRRVRQPIGGEFGFSGELAREFLNGGALAQVGVSALSSSAHSQPPRKAKEDRPSRIRSGADGDASGSANSGWAQSQRQESAHADPGRIWETDVARFGIDIYMTTTALARGARVVQAFLGAKIHDPKDPGADLAPMFIQVVGTAFRLAAAQHAAWKGVRGSDPVAVIGTAEPVEPEEVRANVELLLRRLREADADVRKIWEEALSPDALAKVTKAMDGEGVPHDIAGDTWAIIVYDLLLAARSRPADTARYAHALVPLYFGRVAAFIDEAGPLDTAGSERLVEDQALAFERRKDHLVRSWAQQA